MKDSVLEDASLNAFSAFAPINRKALATAGGRPARSSSTGISVYPGAAAHNRTPRQPATGAYRRFGKRLADIVLVLLTLPMSLPVIALCAIALWLEGGNPFYSQKRLGVNGRVFSIWKLRTMCRDADAQLERHLAADPDMRREWNLTQKLKNDPRITRIGGLLRKSSLDELPQLLNVLRGEMSVVGPRPMLPDQLPMYENPLPYFAMRPGITGQWQVSDRNENGFAHRSTVDADYYAHLSLPVDLKIIVRTVGVVLRRTGY